MFGTPHRFPTNTAQPRWLISWTPKEITGRFNWPISTWWRPTLLRRANSISPWGARCCNETKLNA
jgi:hypothetical protein